MTITEQNEPLEKLGFPVRVIGHPDLATGNRAVYASTLYVSVAEAIYREGRGEVVEIHWTPTPEDEEVLSDLQQRVRRRWENDRLPDGWMRRSSTRPIIVRKRAPVKKRKAVLLTRTVLRKRVRSAGHSPAPTSNVT